MQSFLSPKACYEAVVYVIWVKIAIVVLLCHVEKSLVFSNHENTT